MCECMDALLAQLAASESDLQILLDELQADTTLADMLNSEEMREAEATLAQMLAGIPFWVDS